MKRKGWVVAVAIVAVVVVYRGCLNQQAPDEQLADHFTAMCAIARDGIDAPEPGIRKLGRYLGKHTDEILGSFGGTIALIERIEDDARHDDRARIARDRIAAPLVACDRDWQRFADAVEADPGASEVLVHAIERLNRTLEILLSSARLEFQRLPRQLGALLDHQLR